MVKYEIVVLGKKNHLSWDVHVAEAFRRLGHNVKLVQFNEYPFWLKVLRIIILCFCGKAIMKRVISRCGANRWGETLAAERPNLIFITNLNFVPEAYYLVAQSVRPETKVFGWDGDGFQAVGQYIHLFDHLFECGMAIQRNHPQYVYKVSTLCFAANDAFYYNEGIPNRENKVYFCGADNPVRLKYLSELLDLPVVLKGWGWDRFVGRVRNWEIVNRAITNHQVRDDYNRYAIALNISRFSPESYMFFNMRTFEAPSCGACLITQRSPYLDEYFEFDKEIVVYDTVQELKQKIQWLLDNPEIRSRIAQAGEIRVKKDHTYQARMKLVIDRYEHMLTNAGG